MRAGVAQREWSFHDDGVVGIWPQQLGLQRLGTGLTEAESRPGEGSQETSEDGCLVELAVKEEWTAWLAGCVTV